MCVAPEQSIAVFLQPRLVESKPGHEEGGLECIQCHNTDGTVDAEGLESREDRAGPDGEGYKVREGGDGDGYPGVPQGQAHPLLKLLPPLLSSSGL